MKKILGLAILLVTANLAVQAQSKELRQVATAVEELKQAMLTGDKQQLESLTATNLTYGHSGGKIEDKAAFVEALTSGKSDFIKIDLANQSVIITKKVAVVRHQLTGDLVDNGAPNSVKLGVLLIWQKQKGNWKLLARQAFKL